MPLLFVLSLIIQACFIYHVFRTGRPYWWAFIIMGFPVMGCVIYYLVEVFPGSREHRSARKKVGQIAKAIQPDAELKRRSEEVQICGSAENKASLAEECIQAGMFEDAAILYGSCLAGVHANDPKLMYGLARAHFHNQQFGQANDALSRLRTAHSTFKSGEVRLLLARTLEGLGNTSAALAEYENLIPGFSGLEAKCRYAMLLRSLGHNKQANAILEEVLLHAKRFSVTIDSEREWVAFAKRNLVTDQS